MNASYDDAIRNHYDKVAEERGPSSKSTMEDSVIRDKESETILRFVGEAIGDRTDGEQPLVLDVGCGNGYTLTRLANEMPDLTYLGLEHNEKLRTHAIEQTVDLAAVSIMPADIRDRDSLNVADGAVDVLLCQRVLINLMDKADQKKALDNLVSLVRPGGALLFIESFKSGLATLNAARAEMGLEPISAAAHNLLLEDDFFDHPQLSAALSPLAVPNNLLSTHFYVTRVMHQIMLNLSGQEFEKNSHFVQFFSTALPDGVGNFSPLQFRALGKA